MRRRNGINHSNGGNNMTPDDRKLIIETIKEMQELKCAISEIKGAIREFKEHVIGRVEKLEKKEAERTKEKLSVVSVLIAAMALAVSIIINFFKGGK